MHELIYYFFFSLLLLSKSQYLIIAHESNNKALIPWLRGEQFRCMWGNSGKLLPEAKGRGQQFHMASPIIEEQLIYFSPRSHGISILLPNILYQFYETFGEQYFVHYHKNAWNRKKFILWLGNSLTVSWYKKSEEKKLGKQLEITNYINFYNKVK